MRTQIRTWLLFLALAAASMGMANAVPVVFIGQNDAAAGSVSGVPVIARAAFESGLAAPLLREDFEGFTVPAVIPSPPTPDVVFSFGKAVANLAFPSDATLSLPVTGVFNTTSGGSKFLDVTNSVSIEFTNPLQAFGLYFTDLGDFGSGSITISALTSQGATVNFTPLAGGTNANLLFWGFQDATDSYTRITFTSSSSQNTLDVFGLDDLLGSARTQPSNGVPEPGTLALLGLAGLAALRRRKQ